MTIQEWLVVAAAAVIFIIINVIMWSIIAAKEKSGREADIRRDESSIGKTRTIIASRENYSVQRTENLKPTNKFDIKENIVIVHTDERIK